MIKDITLGQYFPGNSPLHRLDPRMKIVLMVIYITALFISYTAVSYTFMIALTIFLVILSQISFKLYLRGLKPLFIIILFTAVLNMFYANGNVLIEWWIFRITDGGIANALRMIFRIMLLVISTSILTYTTSPVMLTSGLERLLSPLKIIKIPVHEFAMMMTIALRFIPTLLEETDKIMSAQKARGVDFESGGIGKKIKAVVPIIIPLFVSSFRRADELALAMQCRCYNGDSKNRTRLIQYHLAIRDYIFLAGSAIAVVAALLLNHVLIFGF
ncbi:MAG: transporter [Clostridiales bacterium]|nr:MAG: transporter [Clostridiales bacterium]